MIIISNWDLDDELGLLEFVSLADNFWELFSVV